MTEKPKPQDSTKVDPATHVYVATFIMQKTLNGYESHEELYHTPLSEAIAEKEIIEDDRVESDTIVYFEEDSEPESIN